MTAQLICPLVIYEPLSTSGTADLDASGLELLVKTTGTADADTLNGTAGNDRLIGLGGDDLLTGFGGKDSLSGGDGNDYVKPGEGNDTIDGGAGNDRVGYFDFNGTTGAHVSLLLQGSAQDTGHGMDLLMNIEDLSGTLFDDQLTGDDAANWLWGAIGGDDHLIGNGGDDLLEISVAGTHTLEGGDGNDAVLLDSTGLGGIGGWTVDLSTHGPQDTGNGSMVFGDIESLSGSASDMTNDIFDGSREGNTLAGALGDDILRGGAGGDRLLGDGYIYVWDNGAHTDGLITVFESIGNDGEDQLFGGAGDDTLVGGQGADLLNGGKGIDTFRFTDVADSGGSLIDEIQDLSKLDVIDISAIDANWEVDGDQAFLLVKHLTGHAGEASLVYDKNEAVTLLELDTDGDGVANSEIVIDGNGSKHTDFIL
jgi:Ca2+-binding RTX toxin-like protein